MYHFPLTLSGLKNVNSNFIINSNDVTISGTLQSPITDLLCISSLTIDSKLSLLSVSSQLLDSKCNTLSVSNSVVDSKVGILGVSNSVVDSKIGILGNTANMLCISSTNLQSTDNFLQNEINLINILAISSGNVDIDFGISIAQHDSQLGILRGITYPNTISNLNTLGSSVSYFNTEYQSYVQNNDTNITTLNNLGTSHQNRLNTNDTNIFNIGITLNTHTNKISLLDTEVYTNHKSRLNNLEAFSYGVTWLGVSGGSPSVMDTLQEFSDSVQLGIQGIQALQLSQQAYQAIVNGEFQSFISTQLGINSDNSSYHILNDTENSTQNGLIAENGIAIAGLLLSVGEIETQLGFINTDIGNLGTTTSSLGSTTLNLDHKLNSFILGTTQHLENLDTSITNIGITLNYQSNRINNYENRILIDTNGIKIKGQTIDTAIFTDLNLGVSTNVSVDKDLLIKGILTISGTLQSPSTNLLTISNGIIDTKQGILIRVSMP